MNCVAPYGVESTEIAARLAKVEESYRGQRLADRILRAIFEGAREHDVTRGLLSVEAGNAPAHTLSARLGFRERYRYWYRELR